MMTVEELLVSKKLPFVPSGKDYVIHCLNPEHDDSNPSLRVDRILGIFQCMSCGYKGNLFYLFGQKPNKIEQARERLKRKIQKIRQQSVGYSLPRDALPFVGSWRGISAATFVRFRAFKSAEKDFINRVVFPITDITGRIVAFIGRDDTDTLDKKYLIHPGGVILPFFPNVTPIQGRIIAVEGIFDMLNLHDKGLTNAVTTFGCNTIREGYFDLLKIQGVTGIDIIYDNDKPGQDGAKKAKELLEKEGYDVVSHTLKDHKDPGELTQDNVNKLREYLYG